MLPGLPAKVLLKANKDMDTKAKNKHNHEISVNL